MAKMTKVEKLKAQQAEIQKQIDALSDTNRPKTLADIKEKIKLYGFSASELGFKAKPATKAKTAKEDKEKAPAKYKNEKGQEWAGKGAAPLWLKENGKLSDKLKKKYAIEPTA